MNDLLFERILAPFPGDNRVGEYVRFDPTYDKVKFEIMKLTAPAAGAEGGIDWKAIADGSAELLSSKTKDLNLAAFLCLAQCKLEGYMGLAQGLRIISKLLDNYWEDMFPPTARMKARTQVFQWMDERLSAMIGALEPQPTDAPSLRECKEIADDLQNKVAALVKGPVTGFSQLRTEINLRVEKLPAKPAEDQQKAAKDPEKEQPAPEQKEKRQTAGTPAQAIETPTKIESIAEGLTAIGHIVHLIRAVQPLNSIAYRLARIIAWEEMKELPPQEEGGTTPLTGPRPDAVEPLRLMFKASNWKDLTEEAEAMFLSGGGTIFFDLQRYVALGLAAQGGNEAADAVLFETGRLVSRLPGLKTLKFATGLPFADPTTLGWLDEAAQKASGTGGKVTAIEDESWLKEPLEKAQKGNISEALQQLSTAVSEAKGPKEAMKRRLAAAKLFINFGYPQWAIPLLNSLDSAMGEVNLVSWDPVFCAEVWGSHIRALQQLEATDKLGEEDRKTLNKLRQNLFEADLALAAALSPKPTT
jgi:type VI secretion system protein VasJ